MNMSRRSFLAAGGLVAAATAAPFIAASDSAFGAAMAESQVIGILRLRRFLVSLAPTGGELHAAVSAFQKQQGIPITGIVDDATATALRAQPENRPAVGNGAAHLELDAGVGILRSVSASNAVLLATSVAIPDRATSSGFRSLPRVTRQGLPTGIVWPRAVNGSWRILPGYQLNAASQVPTSVVPTSEVIIQERVLAQFIARRYIKTGIPLHIVE